MGIVKNLVEEDIILSNHKLSDKEIIRAYSVLCKKLNKQIVDLEIDHDLLIDDLALYKKALELACESVVKHEKRVDEEMGMIAFFGKTFDYDVNEFVEFFLQQAKEKIDEQKTSKKERKD